MPPHEIVWGHLLTTAAFDARRAVSRKAPRVAGVCACCVVDAVSKERRGEHLRFAVGLSFGTEIALHDGDWEEQSLLVNSSVRLALCRRCL